MKNSIKYFLMFVFVVFAAIFMTGCANPSDCVISEDPSGFWWGLWNGLTCFFAFFGSLFSDNIVIYDTNNNGGWYDFGFVLGAGILFGGSGSRA